MYILIIKFDQKYSINSYFKGKEKINFNYPKPVHFIKTDSNQENVEQIMHLICSSYPYSGWDSCQERTSHSLVANLGGLKYFSL